MNGLYEKLLEEKVVVLDIETTGLCCGEEGADRAKKRRKGERK